MKYTARPVEVDAYRIVDVCPPASDGSTALFLDNNGMKTASPAMLARMEPAIGDYWVVQSDGYEYLNPKAVFERKYEPSPPLLTSEFDCLQRLREIGARKENV